MSLAIALPFLAAVLLTLAVRREMARFRQGKLIRLPPPLRHTWVMGLAFLLVAAFFVLPALLDGRWLLGITSFIALGWAWRGWSLLFEDLRHHWREGRGLFGHEQDCKMVGGNRDTFLDKRRGSQ